MEKLAVAAIAGNVLIRTDPNSPANSNVNVNRSSMPKRILGKTGAEVSALVIGGVAGMVMKPTPEFNPSELANAALDSGITYFDTASAYGDGQSPEGRLSGNRFLLTPSGKIWE